VCCGNPITRSGDEDRARAPNARAQGLKPGGYFCLNSTAEAVASEKFCAVLSATTAWGLEAVNRQAGKNRQNRVCAFLARHLAFAGEKKDESSASSGKSGDFASKIFFRPISLFCRPVWVRRSILAWLLLSRLGLGFFLRRAEQRYANRESAEEKQAHVSGVILTAAGS
jgi:hypothetical protein